MQAKSVPESANSSLPLHTYRTTEITVAYPIVQNCSLKIAFLFLDEHQLQKIHILSKKDVHISLSNQISEIKNIYHV